MTRVYYHLEPVGAARLAEMIQEYETAVNGVLKIVRGEEYEKES